MLVATGVLALGTAGVYTYASARTLAWRYLFPGVAGMLVFVAFPLLYTMQIGFTNYSSNNLLAYERSRAYLLDQTTVDEARALASALVRNAQGEVRLLLSPPEGAEGPRFVSPPLKLDAAPAAPLVMTPLDAAAPSPGTPLTLRETLAARAALLPMKAALPDGRVLSYAGVREFGVIEPLWAENPDGSLVQKSSGTVYKSNFETGFFENAQGERMTPGFKVGIGFANYARMVFDPDFRGPFLAIFVWTVVFAALTVVFSTAIGMTLAVVLNWEALKYRTLYRTLLFLPYAVPGFISILVFKGLFNQNFGEINAILNAVFGVKPAWFADPTLAKAMILIVNTWLGFPYMMVVCMGLIKSIPSDLYEASAVAGAGPITNFVNITAPLIIKPLTPLLISSFAFNFNNFVLISLLTGGRPDFLDISVPAGTTDILVSYTMRMAFQDSGQQFGLASAISTVIFFIVAGITLLQMRFTRLAESDKR